MDVISHALWAGAAVVAIGRRTRVTRGQLVGALTLAVVPDVGQLLPIAAWSLSQDHPWRLIEAWIAATPGHEPAVPGMVRFVSHHLHCGMHSAVVAGVVTLAAWRWNPAWLVPLIDWWLHIAIDIPTHSSDYYAVPFLYPLTYWSVSGIAWTTPWLLGANYAVLAGAYAALYFTRPRGEANAPKGAA